jgi:hypothetical protein
MVSGSVLASGRPRLARAQSAEEPIRLDYQSGPGCPDEASFVARIRARTQRAHLVTEGESAREFDVRIAASGRPSGPSGTVTVVNHGHAEGARSVSAGTCEEVADALSLIVALALAPRALAPAAPEPPSSTVPSSAPAPPRSPPSTPSPSGEDLPSPATSDAAVKRGPGPLGHHFFGEVDFVVATGVTPVTLFGGSPSVGWRSTGASLVGLSVRAAFLRIGTGPQAASGAAVRFTWTVGRVDGCGLFWPDRRLRAGGCARIESGLLDGTGEGIVGARTQHAAWVTVGTLARIEWTFVGPLLLDLEAGPTFRTVSGRFTFYPDTTVYQVPIVGLDAEAGLGLHFL